MLEEVFDTYLLDVTFDPPAFVPFDGDNIYTGINIIADRCPGELQGVIHADGQKAVEVWVAEHPNWYDLYHKLEDGETADE